MRTRRSVRTSPLAYDPEVEKSARLRRKAVIHFSTNLDFAGLEELFIEMSDDNASVESRSPPQGCGWPTTRTGNLRILRPIVYPVRGYGACVQLKIQAETHRYIPG
ncbi:hypothetical protein Tco_0959479 [Tanacetum coccineum]